MKPYEIILKMIEEVDPSDTAKLDEIDARFECFRMKYEFLGIDYSEDFPIKFAPEAGHWEITSRMSCKQYTRSRDAAASILPENWNISAIEKNICGWEGRCYIYKNRHPIKASVRAIKTEPLMRLHLGVQAIAYERGE